MSKGMPNAISVLAVAERGAMFDPSAVFYMEKIAVGPDAADAIDITAPIGENIRAVAKAKQLVGVRRDGVHPGPAAARAADRGGPRGRCPDPAHLRRRRRRRDRGVPARAPASTCWSASAAHPRASSPPPRSAAWAARSRASWRRRTTTSARRPSTPATTSTGSFPPRIWCPARTSSSAPPASPTATCCTGVRYFGGGCTTQSIVMRSKSGTVRMIEAYHRLSKLNEYSADRFHRRQQRLPAAAVVT